MTNPDDHKQIERAFHRDMVALIAFLSSTAGYNPTRFAAMVSEHGGAGAARRLLQQSGTSYGFSVLWEKGLLRNSVEAHVILPVYASLFTDEEVAVASERLSAHGLDVDAYLRGAQAD